MTEAVFLRLNDRFALGADDLQWILYRSRREAPADGPFIARDWKPISFVSSTKDILLRCMRKKGCIARIEAQEALSSYPSTFRAWKAANHRRINAVGAP